MMPSVKVFVVTMVVLAVLFAIGSWTLHRQEERPARILCAVVAVICAVAAIGALLGPHWYV